ncbi:DUF1592 domain-containing protein [Anatilimnocola sp. NA78]|uniref:DUF1592 domain-containing protein n=1 Tax=Anatilimnocola sp. NA78 TaxID=3415683 RepID=UPI003CE59CD2
MLPLSKPISKLVFCVGIGLLAAASLPTCAQDAVLATTYSAEIRVLVGRYCHECHSAKRMEAEIDLTTFATLADVRKQAQLWQKVGEMLESGQMPPPESKQPSEAERTALKKWVREFLTREAAAHAGDPGQVVLRRLSNAEYTYTVRDLLALPALEPTKEFPVDGAAGEGFTNTGNALVMSPALVTKYLDAAKELSSHAVLLPTGFRFSRSNSRRDWTNETLEEIRKFYDQFTDPSGGERVNLQGIIFETNGGGRLPIEKYLAATIVERDGLTSGVKSFDKVAGERGLSAKYLALLWQELTSKEPSILLGNVRARWRDAKQAEDAGPLAAEIAAWQRGLWRFASVGHIGKVGGPKQWLEPVSPLVAKQDFKVKLPAPDAKNEIVFSLVAGDLGDGNEHDYVVWQKPRFVTNGKPELQLRDIAGLQGIDKDQFGKPPKKNAKLDEHSVCVQAATVLVVRVPADQVAGYEFMVTATLDANVGREGTVQVEVLPGAVAQKLQVRPAEAKTVIGQGAWTGDNRQTSFAAPMLASDGAEARKRIENDLNKFRDLFPAALCYTKIVPVDEVVTLTLFYREDDHLARLMLDDAQRAKLDRLWNELRFISQDSQTLVDALEQLIQFATQDANPKVFEPLREPFANRAAAFRQQMIEAEPKHLDELLVFAGRAYRRPLSEKEAIELRQFYAKLRADDLPHEEAFRLSLARLLISPAFLYKIEKPVPGTKQGPINNFELATRLSYFLWSSQPDAELLRVASEDGLHDKEVLLSQTRRMLKDAKTRRMATEFACQWLQIYEFDQLDEKSERHFPTFVSLRSSMYEESILFLTHLLQNDGRIGDVLAADFTFVNGDLAQHYGIPNVAGPEFRRVDGIRQQHRGGILAHATTLAKQAGASRTSPILRGNWVSEVLLGERLPRPPKDVPQLPDEDSATATKSVRELVAAHSSVAQCAVCHKKIDPLGFSLESYDAIGRHREKDLSNHPIDTKVTTIDNVSFDGLPGLRDYLLTTRRDSFNRQFCRKLLGYSLGRGIQLSDEPLLAEMQANLKANDGKLIAAIETVVLSRQFREIRGQSAATEP